MYIAFVNITDFFQKMQRILLAFWMVVYLCNLFYIIIIKDQLAQRGEEKKSLNKNPLSSEFLCLWSFSLFMAPRDSGIGTELDLELDEGSYEEEEEGNMDEERWGTMQTAPLLFIITSLGSTASWTPTCCIIIIHIWQKNDCK